MKLYYFDIAGRGEAIRLLLFHAGVKFEEVRIQAKDWPSLKPKFELQQVPCLEEDGKLLCQSYAIMEYLGAKYGYLPKNYDDLYKVIFVMNTVEELFLKAMSLVSPRSVFDEKGKEEMKKKLIDSEGPLRLKALDRTLKNNCTQEFIVGKKWTIADFYILGFYVGFLNNTSLTVTFQKTLKEKYPVLTQYTEKMLKKFSHFYHKCNTKLYYFDMPGRAEMIRIMLKHMKTPFEDIRIKFEDWPKEKTSGKFELEMVPVLKCDSCGINFSQTDAIMQRVGAKFGYLPLKKPEKLYKVIWFCKTIKDLMETCMRIGYQPLPESLKKQFKEEFFSKTAKVIFDAMESKLKMNKTQDFLVGRDYTIADFYLVGAWRAFILNPLFPEFKPIIEGYPTLTAYFEKQNKLL